jgi:transcriptional regulator with XRE-family HTH domain
MGENKLINNLPNLVQEYLEQNKSKGVTAATLARMSGVDASTLSRLLKSEQNRIDLKTVERLKEVIGFDVADVIIEVSTEPAETSTRARRNPSKRG